MYLGGATAINSVGGISGIQHNSRTMFLVGVFLNNQEPSGQAPPILNFSDDSFTSISPLLAQTFFVGDGLTGQGTGSTQIFNAPDGATRLYLGFADGFDFSGSPGYYSDNVGSLDVTVTTSASVPDTGTTLALFGIALLGLFGVTRLKRPVEA